jgi:hypothetical protein
LQYTEHRSRNNLTSPGDERVELLKLLEQEARKITSQPPGPVENSQASEFQNFDFSKAAMSYSRFLKAYSETIAHESVLTEMQR